MKNYKSYGIAPYDLAVIHGGPGGIGDVRALAFYLASFYSVLEPFQTQKTIQGQLDELKKLIQYPITLVGYSWGAMLSILFTFQNPHLVKKLILIGCPPLTSEYVALIENARKNKLTSTEQKELEEYLEKITATSNPTRFLLNKLMHLMSKADSFNLVSPISYDDIIFQKDIYEAVWPEATQLRNNGTFLNSIQKIKAPIIFIHGIHDPHPLKAIESILPSLQDCKLYALEKCGHTPWFEKEAKKHFYEILKKEIR